MLDNIDCHLLVTCIHGMGKPSGIVFSPQLAQLEFPFKPSFVQRRVLASHHLDTYLI